MELLASTPRTSIALPRYFAVYFCMDVESGNAAAPERRGGEKINAT